MSSPQSLLRKYGIRPLKRLGQCFLTDRNVMERILRAADLHPDDRVLEIGSGVGILTAMLAARAGHVTALEVDRMLVDLLRSELRDVGNISVIEADVLEFDFSTVFAGPGGRRIKVIGNVPYNISSQILLRLLEYREGIGRIVLMLQREVAERFASGPGSKDYGPLSIYVALYTVPVLEARVPASCFFPQPDVDSRILRLDVRERPLCDLRNPAQFRRLVRASFASRRKTLMNNLKASGLAGEDRVRAALDSLGIDGRRRAETLSVSEFADLSNVLDKTGYSANVIPEE